MATQTYADFGTNAPDVEQLQIERRRQMAQALMQKGAGPAPQGQMVSGHYVAPSWTEQLAHALNGYAGRKQLESADAMQADLGQRQSAQNQRDLGAFAEALRGTPARAEADGNNPSAYMPGQTAQPPDMQKALAIALQSRSPGLQQAGGNMLTQMMPKPAEWTAFEKPDGKGGFSRGLINKNSPDPINSFQAGGAQPAKLEAVNVGGGTSFQNPYEPKAEGAPFLRNQDPNKPFSLGPDNQPVPNMGFQNYQMNKSRAGATQVGLNLPKIEGSAMTAGNEDFIKNSYRPLMNSADAAQKHNQQISLLDSLDLTGKTGWGTETKAQAANVLTGLGLAPADAKSLAGNAQTFNAIVGQQVFTILGAQNGVQTEGDAQRARATLTQLGNTPNANRFLLDMAKATNNLTIKRARYFNDNVPKARAQGDLTRVEQGWMQQSEKESIWNDPAMKRWAASGGSSANKQAEPSTFRVLGKE